MNRLPLRFHVLNFRLKSACISQVLLFRSAGIIVVVKSLVRMTFCFWNSFGSQTWATSNWVYKLSVNTPLQYINIGVQDIYNSKMCAIYKSNQFQRWLLYVQARLFILITLYQYRPSSKAFPTPTKRCLTIAL